jgi:hypothetical protein
MRQLSCRWLRCRRCRPVVLVCRAACKARRLVRPCWLAATQCRQSWTPAPRTNACEGLPSAASCRRALAPLRRAVVRQRRARFVYSPRTARALRRRRPWNAGGWPAAAAACRGGRPLRSRSPQSVADRHCRGVGRPATASHRRPVRSRTAAVAAQSSRPQARASAAVETAAAEGRCGAAPSSPHVRFLSLLLPVGAATVGAVQQLCSADSDRSRADDSDSVLEVEDARANSHRAQNWHVNARDSDSDSLLSAPTKGFGTVIKCKGAIYDLWWSERRVSFHSCCGPTYSPSRYECGTGHSLRVSRAVVS